MQPRIPLGADLAPTFEELSKSSVAGIAGVKRLRRGSPSEQHLALLMTHGNEPAGLALARFLIDHPEVLGDSHDVTLALANIDAAARYFEAGTDEERSQCRFVGTDMNRQRENFGTSGFQPRSVEEERVLRLVHEFQGMASILDVHSFDTEGEGLGLSIVGEPTKLDQLCSELPCKTLLRGIVPVQKSRGTKTQPVSAVFRPHMAVEIETGQHQSPQGCRVAVETGIAWLRYFHLLRGECSSELDDQHVYDVLDSVMVPDTSYTVVDPVLNNMFAPVESGQVLAHNPAGETVRASQKGQLIFGPDKVTFTADDITSEVWWLVSNDQARMRTVHTPTWLQESSS